MNCQFLTLLLLLGAAAVPLHADPQTSSWLTEYATRYARIYTSDASKLAGTASTTWTNGTQVQSSPAYAGVQEISFSANWTYIRTTGLGAHVMGPWYLNAAHTQTFPNLPKNQKVTYRFPRTPTVPATKTLTGLGAIGYFVDGVAMFDSRDAFYWNGTTEVSGGGTGYWNREAYVNESVSFDPGYAHQENSGTHHYHANPIALRYMLGDHVDLNATTKAYSESTAPVTQHSPILGWVRDGYPIYGPYGYGSAMNAGSGVRRMVTGYTLRNGANGTDNLTATGRTTIPAWAVRRYSVAAAQGGPAVSAAYPLGRYMEDSVYLGDLGQTQGVTFDLDEYNGRFCVTPEFPNGTYAYFVAINASGAPVFPYNIGRAFYGSPTGAAVGSVTETVISVFKGEAFKQETAEVTGVNKTNGNVTLTWSSTEGGTYKVEATSNFTAWDTLTSTQAAAANGVETSYVENGAALANTARTYRVTRTALASFDSVGLTTGGGGTTVPVPGGSAVRGTTVTILVTLPTNPPQPPVNNVPVSITLAGTISGTNISRPSVDTAQCTFAIPANAALGAQNVVVTFSPAPTYTLMGGLTVTSAAAAPLASRKSVSLR
jgi:hypothetical protein